MYKVYGTHIQYDPIKRFWFKSTEKRTDHCLASGKLFFWSSYGNRVRWLSYTLTLYYLNTKYLSNRYQYQYRQYKKPQFRNNEKFNTNHNCLWGYLSFININDSFSNFSIKYSRNRFIVQRTLFYS